MIELALKHTPSLWAPPWWSSLEGAGPPGEPWSAGHDLALTVHGHSGRQCQAPLALPWGAKSRWRSRRRRDAGRGT